MSASIRVSLLYAWPRLCQDQAACAQSEALLHTNSPRVTKLSQVAVQTFNGLIMEIRINYLGTLPQL